MERESYNKMHLNEEAHWWFIARRLILKKILDRYYRNKKPKKVLEVGCGSGGNLTMLKEYGEIFAMELDDDARNIANNRNICNVKKGRLPEDIPFNDGFDLICMLDVLEHIDDDLAALSSVKEKLNQQGKLLITVPAYKFLWSAHDVACHHKRRYTRKQLINLVLKSGLKVQYTSYFNTILFPVIAAVRILNNIFGGSGSSAKNDVNLPPTFVNKFLRIIFSAERLILPAMFFPFGVSVLIIAENEKEGKG